jgi:RNA polymerase sigma-70 factor (ECF subfamily)
MRREPSMTHRPWPVSFEDLWGDYQKPLCVFVGEFLRLPTDHETVLDTVQEVIVKLFRTRATYDGRRSLRTWVYSIARNHCIDVYRKQRSSENIASDCDVYELPQKGATYSPEYQAIQEDVRRKLLQAIDELPGDQRALLFLRYYVEMTSKEIAGVMRRPQGTVRYQLRIARQRVAASLKEVELVSE